MTTNPADLPAWLRNLVMAELALRLPLEKRRALLADLRTSGRFKPEWLARLEDVLPSCGPLTLGDARPYPGVDFLANESDAPIANRDGLWKAALRPQAVDRGPRQRGDHAGVIQGNEGRGFGHFVPLRTKLEWPPMIHINPPMSPPPVGYPR